MQRTYVDLAGHNHESYHTYLAAVGIAITCAKPTLESNGQRREAISPTVDNIVIIMYLLEQGTPVASCSSTLKACSCFSTIDICRYDIYHSILF